MSDLSTTSSSDSDSEYNRPAKRKYKSLLHHGLNKTMLRYHKRQNRKRKSAESAGTAQSYEGEFLDQIHESNESVYCDYYSTSEGLSTTSTDSSDSDSSSTTEESDDSATSSISSSTTSESDAPQSEDGDDKHVPLFEGSRHLHCTLSLCYL